MLSWFACDEVDLATLMIEYGMFALYLLIGPVVWVLFGVAMFAGRRRMSLVERAPLGFDLPEAPRVSILIPAKDEGQRIAECLNSAMNQNYPNFHVIGINDRSTDHTGRVMDELAAANANFQVIHIRDGELPAGWTGKCNALQTAVAAAEGQWLLLVDSDVVLSNDALSATLKVGIEKRCDVVTLLPRLESGTFWEELVVPLAGAACSALYLVALTNNDHKPRTAFANGQYLLIRRDTYDAMGGHRRVRDRFCEDVEIARYLKANGKRVRISWGAELAAVRMYSSLSSILRGWSRNFFAGSLGRPWRILLGLVFLLLCTLSAYFAVAWGFYRLANPVNTYGGYGWILAGVIHWTIVTVTLGIIYRWTGNRPTLALALPLGGGLLAGIFIRSLWMCVTGNVEWRGTRYAHRMDGNLLQTPIQRGN